MVIEDKKIEKICNFYVSDFHLEMILLPYINKKIEEKEPIQIISERNLENSINELISKVNLEENKKQEILKLNWNIEKSENIKENSNIIIIGTKEFIEEKNDKIKDIKTENLKIIDCYNFDEVKNDMNEILHTHSKSMNTLGNTQL